MNSSNKTSEADLASHQSQVHPIKLELADAAILFACLLVMTWGLGRYGLFEPHEGHFAGIGREMLLSGDWVTPHLNGSPYLNKPPFLYWSVMLSNALGGINEFYSRLPGALYGWVGVVVAWLWAGRLFGRSAARLAAPMATISVGWFMFTHQLMTDATLSTFSFASLYAFWRCTTDPTNRRRWLLFYFFHTIALMTKGPGAIFPLLVGICFIVWRRRWRLASLGGTWWWGIPLTLAPLVTWGVFVNFRNPGFFHHIFMNEIWNRLNDTRWPPDYKVSAVTWYQYIVITIIWCAPWSLLLPFSGRFFFRRCRNLSDPSQSCLPARSTPPNETPANKDIPNASQQQADGMLILLLGALWPLLLFLPISSRLVYYCLPTVLPFATLTACWWSQQAHASSGAKEGEGLEKLFRKPPGILLGTLGLVTFSAGFWVTPLVKDIPELARVPETLALIPIMAFLLGGGLALGGLLMALGKWRSGAAVAFVFMGLANMKAADGLVAFQDIRSSKRMVAELDPVLKKDTLWIYEGSFELGAVGAMSYYLGEDDSGNPRFLRVMTDDTDLKRIQPKFGNIKRSYATSMEQLNELWRSERPVVFVTDMMRKDFETKELQPKLPENHGPSLKEMYGFRKVYANEAARKRLKGRF